MVEEGLTDLDDILREGISALELEHDRAKAALDRIRVADRAPITIPPEVVERFGQLMRENVMAGDVPFRKGWIQAIVDRIEVDDRVICIIGDKTSLEQAIGTDGPAAAAGVRSFGRKWRA